MVPSPESCDDSPWGMVPSQGPCPAVWLPGAALSRQVLGRALFMATKAGSQNLKEGKDCPAPPTSPVWFLVPDVSLCLSIVAEAGPRFFG